MEGNKGSEPAHSQEGTHPDDSPLTPSEFYEKLIKESPLRPGDHGICPKEMGLSGLDWFRPELVQEGKDFIRRNFYSTMLAHLVSLMWIFTFKPGRAVLLRTGGSNSDNSRDRYLSTVLHIKLWYESDFIEQAARGSQDIYKVRRKHAAAVKSYNNNNNPENPENGTNKTKLSEDKARLLKVLREQLSDIEETQESLSELISGENPQVPMSQLSMVVTQFCFLGFLVLLPEAFGLVDKRGMDGFAHLWAVYGRLLGIEDGFNLGVHYLQLPGSYSDGTKDLSAFRLLFQNIFLPSLKNTDEPSMDMWQSLLKGFSSYMTGLRLKAVVRYLLQYGASQDCSHNQDLNALMDWRDRFSFRLLKFSTLTGARSRVWRGFRNRSIRLTVFMAQRRFLPEWKGRSKKGGDKNNKCPHKI